MRGKKAEMTLLPLVWVLLLAVCAVLGCHPECRYVSDDPVCAAICKPKCQPPVCGAQCQNSAHDATCSKPNCWVRCQESGGCETEECPLCETVCNPYFYCSAQGAVCSPICEALQCSWSCRTPIPGQECPLPKYVLQCDPPACAYSGASTLVACATLWITCLLYLSV